MKDGLKYIVGKQVAAVVIAEAKRQPRQQVFLVFTDGSRFEFYGEDFTCCAGLDDGARIEGDVRSGGGTIARVYDKRMEREWPPQPLSTGPTCAPSHVRAPDTLEGLMTRDLNAWNEAKAAIDKVRKRA